MAGPDSAVAQKAPTDEIATAVDELKTQAKALDNTARTLQTAVEAARATAAAAQAAADSARDSVAKTKNAVDAAAAAPKSDDEKATAAREKLDRVHGLFKKAAKAFGDEHVVLAPAFYAGWLDASDTSRTKGREVNVAGFVSVPLWGVGGGHGADWWPVIASKAQADAIDAFDRGVTQYIDTLEASKATIHDLMAAKDALDGLAHLFSDDGAEFEPGDAYKAAINVAQALWEAGSAATVQQYRETLLTAVFVGEDATRQKSRWAAFKAAFDDGMQDCGEYTADTERSDLGKSTAWVPWETATVGHLRDLVEFFVKANDCHKPNEVYDLPEGKAQARSAQKMLDEAVAWLLMEHRADQTAVGKAVTGLQTRYKELRSKIKGANSDSMAPRRHNFLIGPTVGVPLGDDTTSAYLYGAQIEAGGEGFRVGVFGGLVGAYEADDFTNALKQGWFAGLGVSGEFGDDLFHMFNGGLDIARELSAATTEAALAPQN